MDEIMQLEASTKVNGVRNLSVDLTSGIYQAIGTFSYLFSGVLL